MRRCVIFGRSRMKQSQNPSAVRSKQQIIEALLKLMEKYPYSEISVKQIVMETDLARKTFYRNFSSKDDVLDAYINQEIYEYTRALMKEPEPLSVIFAFCEKNRKLLSILHKNNMLYLLLLRLNEVIPQISETTDMKNNPFRLMMGELEPDYLIAFNVGAIWNVIFKWVERGMDESLEDVKAVLGRYIEGADRSGKREQQSKAASDNK